jgi:5-methylcytosine-specific restriction enzyme subunit McrC
MLGGVDGTEIIVDHFDSVRARQAVGVIATPGVSLEILPKVDSALPDESDGTIRSRLVHMLDVALGLGLSEGESTSMAHGADSLLDIFIDRFASRLLAETRRGLPQRYGMREEDLRALRGQLNTVRQFTLNFVRPDRLACRFDALHGDLPLMQVMKACVLLVTPLARSLATRRKLNELRFVLTDVSDVARARLPWHDVQIDRTNHRWQSVLDLAGRLLGEQWQQTHAQADQPDGVSLLFQMNDLFERYIAVQLRRGLTGSGLDVVAQSGGAYCLGRWTEGAYCSGNSHLTRPDILLRRGGKVVAIIDTKWKARRKGIDQGDIYQMMAYARLYKCSRLMLLYPAADSGCVTQVESRGLAGGSERLDIAEISITQQGAGVKASLRKLVENLL